MDPTVETEESVEMEDSAATVDSDPVAPEAQRDPLDHPDLPDLPDPPDLMDLLGQDLRDPLDLPDPEHHTQTRNPPFP